MSESKKSSNTNANNLSQYLALMTLLHEKDPLTVDRNDAKNAGIDLLLLNAMLESDPSEKQDAIDNYIKTRSYRTILKKNPVLGSILISNGRKKGKGNKDSIATALATVALMEKQSEQERLDDLSLCLFNLGDTGLPMCLFLHHNGGGGRRRMQARSRGIRGPRRRQGSRKTRRRQGSRKTKRKRTRYHGRS